MHQFHKQEKSVFELKKELEKDGRGSSSKQGWNKITGMRSCLRSLTMKTLMSRWMHDLLTLVTMESANLQRLLGQQCWHWTWNRW